MSDANPSGRRDERRPHIGLALAGGGVEGAIYEIGALRALEEAVDGFECNEADIFVGVSAGAIIGAFLANGIGSIELTRAVTENRGRTFPVTRDVFYTPAIGEMVRRSLMTPRLGFEALWEYATHPGDQSLLDSLTRLSRALPVGFFDNEPIRAFLQRVFAEEGRSDDFRKLAKQLFVVVADVDSGEAVCFGAPGRDHVPISRAVQASAALPVLYSPVEIEGRHYGDGILLKTLHASVALDAGADLLLCINPLVPVDTSEAVAAGVMRRGKLIHRGLPTVLAQTFRTMVHSRLTVGMASYEPRYPDRDVVLIEPGRDDYRMFFTNVFKFADRKAVCEHAYRSTRRQLLERRDELGPIFERYGKRLRVDILEDEERSVWGERESLAESDERRVTEELDRTLDRLEGILQNGD